MGRRPDAREQEERAALRPAKAAAAPAPANEAVAMLVRRGLAFKRTRPDLPFPADLDEPRAARLAALLRHYGFRLFLRGAIASPDGFAPADATKYLAAAHAQAHAEALVDLGLARRLPGGRYRLVERAHSFGGTLEWFVARELRSLGFETAVGYPMRLPGTGGDLDVVAAAEGKLVYLELKSSPPKHLADSELDAFLRRLDALRPHVALFVMDTSLRLSDKVLPMLTQALARLRGAPPPAPRRVVHEIWALSPHFYALDARPDLVANLARAIAEGLAALAPRPF